MDKETFQRAHEAVMAQLDAMSGEEIAARLREIPDNVDVVEFVFPQRFGITPIAVNADVASMDLFFVSYETRTVSFEDPNWESEPANETDFKIAA